MRRLTIFAAVILLVYWLALFVATHVPDVPNKTGLPYGDKLAHTVAYAILAWLAAMVLRILHWPLTRICVTVFMTCAIYGAIDEWLQQYTGRRSDVLDWTADVVGASIGLAIFLVSHETVRRAYYRLFSRRKNEKQE